MTVRGPRRGLFTCVALVGLMAASACNLRISTDAEAKDQWQRRYTLAQGGTLEIRNTNGLIHIEPTDDNTLDVSADRVVRAVTDQAAKEALGRFEIQETVSPDRVTIDSTNRSAGMMINLQRHVDFHVRMPHWANVTIDTTNGNIELVGPRLTGKLHATATNGRINAAGLENAAAIETTNGTITLDVARLGDDGLSCSTTNGAITVTFPTDVKARISARVTNGSITEEGLQVAVSEQSKRRLDGTIGGGGPMVRLETTNGLIRMKGK